MPDDTEKNQSLDSSNYNPNRPQKEDHESTKKVVDTAAKGAAEYFAPGVGGQVYDTAKKVPVVGEGIDKVTDTAAEALDKVPGVKKVTKALDDSGAVDAVNQGINMLGAASGNPSGAANAAAGAAKGPAGATGGAPGVPGASPKSTASNAKTSQASTTKPTGYRKNNEFNLNMGRSEEDPISDATLESEMPPEEGKTTSSSNSLSSPLQNNNLNNNSENEDNKEEDALEKAAKSFIKRHIVSIILGGGGVLFFFFLIMLISGGLDGSGKFGGSGYYDTACNFNETTVNVSSCTTDETISSMSIDEYVKKMTNAYINGDNYSDESIKALMIIIKTNALSYGNYNSSSKTANIQVCDVYSGTNPSDATTDLWMFENDYEKNLNALYDDIEEYIYVSSSYTSTISTLSSVNALELNDSILSITKDLGNNNNPYNTILNEIYKSEENEEENTVYRENLFLGDSRTKGMENTGVINDANTVYGVGYGYNWLIGNGTFDSSKTNNTEGGIKGINSKIKDNTLYNIIIWLGINDIGVGADKYFEKYKELATSTWSKHNIYIVSVGPVDDSKAKNVKNSDITTFNSDMESLISDAGISNLKYINLNYNESSINSYDGEGLHYGANDYKEIFNIINSNVETNLSTTLTLYRLSNYCSFYNLTENDAYWWPVGSATATSGNIYGGAPVSTGITSYFGIRAAVFGSGTDNHGAIDIGGVGVGTPVIATKDGEVKNLKSGWVAAEGKKGMLSYGNYVLIQHDDEISSRYAHLSQVIVSVGDIVKQGQIIGYTGSTGNSSGPHLHFEIILNGNRVDPLDYVSVDTPRPVNRAVNYQFSGTTGDYQNMVCSTLLSSGLSNNATAGVMANLKYESAFVPHRLQGDYGWNNNLQKSVEYTEKVDSGAISRYDFIYNGPGGGGYGLAQWTARSRKEKLYDYIKNKNVSIGDFSAQMEYLLHELQTDYKDVYKVVTSNKSALDIGTYWCDKFESPGGSEPCSVYNNCPSQHCVDRTKDAIETFKLIEYVNNGCRE